MARQNRTLKKVNKVLARVEKHIEETRDALETPEDLKAVEILETR